MTDPAQRLPRSGPILVTGARGMLGRDLVSVLRRHLPPAEIFALGREELDITDEGAVRERVDEVRPAVIINCAAYTDVDGCEAERERAFLVNARGPELLARAASRAGALLLHISTDFVFDGAKGAPYREDDPPRPISAYGESKLAGEEAVRGLAPEHLIVRTAWLYGRHGANFVETILRLADRQDELRVVTDQVGSPTWTVELASAVVALLRAGARGTYHAAGRGWCTRYEWAGEILRLAGMERTLVPVTTEEFPRPARRPANSALDCGKLRREVGFRFCPWHRGLARYLRSRQQEQAGPQDGPRG